MCLFFHVLLHCSFVLLFCIVGVVTGSSHWCYYWFIMMQVLLLGCGIDGVVCSLHCLCYNSLITTLMQCVVHHNVGNVFNSSCCGAIDLLCYWWCYRFITLLVLLLVCCIFVVTMGSWRCFQVLNWTPLCCFYCSFALLVATLITCVLVKYYPHQHHLANGKLVVHHVVVHVLFLGTHHCHLPPLVLLLV